VTLGFGWTSLLHLLAGTISRRCDSSPFLPAENLICTIYIFALEMGETTTMNIRSEIVNTFTHVAKDQSMPLAPLTDDLPLIDAGLDSLCLAIIVARLEELLGVDPFSSSEDMLFPVTFGDFVKCYEKAAMTPYLETASDHA
jgi:acyl carrier protein